MHGVLKAGAFMRKKGGCDKGKVYIGSKGLRA